MNDDLGKKVEQIAQLLGQDSVPDNVKELITLFASSMNKKEDTAVEVPSPGAEQVEKKPDNTDSVLNENMLNTARKAMERLNPASDPRVNLLNAIKPFMNSRRQKKISNCIQILQVASLSRLLNDKEKQER